MYLIILLFAVFVAYYAGYYIGFAKCKKITNNVLKKVMKEHGIEIE